MNNNYNIDMEEDNELSLKMSVCMKKIIISRNSLSDAQVRCLSTLLSNNITLKTLIIRYNTFFKYDEDDNDNDDRDYILEPLVEALKGLINLTTLNIGGNEITNGGINTLINVLNFTRITTFNITNNYICDAGAEALAQMLKSNTNLTTLIISKNNISFLGAKCIADSLEMNTTLLTLSISYNRIGDDGVNYLAGALKKNSTLTTLSINYNRISRRGAHYLLDALKINTTLTTLDISKTESYNIEFNIESQIGKDNINQIHLKCKNKINNTDEIEITTLIKRNQNLFKNKNISLFNIICNKLKHNSITILNDSLSKDVFDRFKEFNEIIFY